MCVLEALCEWCADDQQFLRSKQRPLIGGNLPVITAADLFAGCGGMSLGLQEAERRAGFRIEIGLAIDSDPHVAEIYERNLNRKVNVANVTTLFDGQLGSDRREPSALMKSRRRIAFPNLGTRPSSASNHLSEHQWQQRVPKLT
jgi:DNA (cytosine-5)-methyltransferase 1